MLQGIVSGRLGSDAELRDVAGEQVLQFSVATDKKVRGEKVTTWVRCSLWGKRSASLAQYLTRGTPVTCTGELSLREYDGKRGRQTSLELRVSEVDMHGGRNDAQQAPRQAGGRGGQDDEFSDIPF